MSGTEYVHGPHHEIVRHVSRGLPPIVDYPGNRGPFSAFPALELAAATGGTDDGEHLIVLIMGNPRELMGCGMFYAFDPNAARGLAAKLCAMADDIDGGASTQ